MALSRLLILPTLALALAACGGDDDPAPASTAGTYEITFTNMSTGQPMTPPVVAIHDTSVRLYQTGQAASPEVQAIAENGDNDPLVALATSLQGSGVSAAGVAAPDPAGPIGPGGSSTITLTTADDAQVLSVVTMIVCTNDGFTGVDSVALPATGTSTFMAVSYDAGTEVNIIDADYWVPAPPCGGTAANMHTDENGVITAHPGQTGSFDANLDFPAGAQLLQIDVTRN